MTASVFILAHFGHWYISGPVYLVPVLVVLVWLKWSSWRERRAKESDPSSRDPEGSPHS
jgi:hypothetical protein